LLLGAFAGAIPAAQRAAAASSSTTLSIGYLEPVDYLNPFRGLNDPSYVLYGLIYDYLFAFDQDGRVIPSLATNATCTDASCQNWTYTIRQGVTWSDGTPFTAADVNFTINYNVQNTSALFAFAPYVYRIMPCVNTTVNCGAIQTGAWQVTVYFDRPFFPGKQLWFPIVQKKQWEVIPGSVAQTTYNNSNPIGTGAFIADPNIFDEWRTGQPIHLTRNLNFHPVGTHTGPSNITDIYLQQFTDESLMEAALLAGSIDLGKFTSDGYSAVVGRPGIVGQQGLEATQYWNEIGFSQLAGGSTPLNPARYDIAVRQALAKATNKDYIIKNFYGGKGVRGTDLMSPITPQWYYDPVADGHNLTFDLTAANTMLNSAGYTTRVADPQGVCSGTVRSLATTKTVIANDNNATNDSVTIPAGTSLALTMGVRSEFQQEQKTATYLQQQWCQVGVSIKISVEGSNKLTADVYAGVFDTYILYWSGDPDPNYLLSIQSAYTLSGWNDNYWNNDTFNTLYVAQLATADPALRAQTVTQAQRVHYESAAYIIYVYPYGNWAYRTDKWTGWGDWVAHPFRQLDAFWGGNPLFFGLTTVPPPVGGVSALLLAGIGVGAAIIVIAVAAVLWSRRRKKTSEREAEVPLPPK
jgi:peptide/nickel transport system substrate-binding protein